MKNFLKQITHNPYIDWVIIVTLGVVGVLLVALWSFLTYNKVNGVESLSTTATSTKLVAIDINKLNAIADTLRKKGEIYNAPKLPVIDVREPSL